MSSKPFVCVRNRNFFTIVSDTGHRSRARGVILSRFVGEAMSETIEETIQDRALRVIATKQGLPLASVRPESTFEGLGIDSLDRLNILFELEGEFDIQIDDEQAKKVTTLQQMIDGITALVEAKNAKDEPKAKTESSPVS